MQRNGDLVSCRSALSDRSVISDEQMKLFCSIIQFRDGEGCENYDVRHAYLFRTQTLMKKLKFPLSKPNPITRKILLPKQSQYTHLCNMHKSLNADFVHQWFILLSLEVGLHMNLLIAAGPQHVGNLLWNDILMPLRCLHQMWLNIAQIWETFGNTFNQYESGNADFNYQHQADDCEACILSRVGGELQIVLALNHLTVSRKSLNWQKKHPRGLRLKRLTSGWIAAWEERHNHHTLQNITHANMLCKNVSLSQHLYEKRLAIKMIQKLEKNDLQSPTEISFDNHTSDETEYHHMRKTLYQAEHDIIDTYAALRTTAYLPTTGSKVQKSYSSGPTTSLPGYNALPKAFYKAISHNCPNTGYNESKYSVDTLRNNDRAIRCKTKSLMPSVPEIPDHYVGKEYDGIGRNAPIVYDSHSSMSGSDNLSISSIDVHRAEALEHLEHGDGGYFDRSSHIFRPGHPSVPHWWS